MFDAAHNKVTFFSRNGDLQGSFALPPTVGFDQILACSGKQSLFVLLNQPKRTSVPSLMWFSASLRSRPLRRTWSTCARIKTDSSQCLTVRVPDEALFAWRWIAVGPRPSIGRPRKQLAWPLIPSPRQGP
jgi:hypothetical protein